MPSDVQPPEQITLYTARICPWAQRVELAIQEVGAVFIRFEINLQNKPEWYATKVNPASKVPAIAYGGPPVLPDQPSPESEKIAESLVLLEFLADIFPTSELLPKSAVARARVRFFIDAISTRFLPGYFGFTMRGEDHQPLLAGLEALQPLFPPPGSPFTIGDCAIAPFLGRLEAQLRNDVGAFAKGQGPIVYAQIFQDPKFAPTQQYLKSIQERESWKKTFDENLIITFMTKRFRS